MRRTNRDPLDRFAEQRTVLLSSFRRDGSPVGTPVNIAVEDDHAFVRSFDAAWKVKRMRRNPMVEVAPSTFGGKPRVRPPDSGLDSSRARRRRTQRTSSRRSTRSFKGSSCRSVIA